MCRAVPLLPRVYKEPRFYPTFQPSDPRPNFRFQIDGSASLALLRRVSQELLTAASDGVAASWKPIHSGFIDGLEVRGQYIDVFISFTLKPISPTESVHFYTAADLVSCCNAAFFFFFQFSLLQMSFLMDVAEVKKNL